ncbi:MAG: hypothetical protein JNL30_03795 [Rubrivivax sp.]|nr:hypothetical protein [Rubrivivax sp.]
MGLPDKRPTSGALASKLRVTKKLAVNNRGAIKLAQQFGDALVCVRHRTDPEARYRYTTVELLVDKAEVQPRQVAMVDIRVHPREYALRSVVRAAGGTCHRSGGVWRLPKRVATVLRLTNRIVPPR